MTEIYTNKITRRATSCLVLTSTLHNVHLTALEAVLLSRSLSACVCVCVCSFYHLFYLKCSIAAVGCTILSHTRTLTHTHTVHITNICSFQDWVKGNQQEAMLSASLFLFLSSVSLILLFHCFPSFSLSLPLSLSISALFFLV